MLYRDTDAYAYTHSYAHADTDAYAHTNADTDARRMFRPYHHLRPGHTFI